jgi:hypothetical protein
MERISDIFEARGDFYYASKKSDHAVELHQTVPGEVAVTVGGYTVLEIKNGTIQLTRLDNAHWGIDEFKKHTGLRVTTDPETGRVHPAVLFTAK